MKEGKKDMLFKLIGSLTSNEKRHFTLYASRHTIGKQNNSLRLFKKLAALKKYDQKEFIQQNKKEPFAKYYSFNKHFLYKLILQSLHSFHEGNKVEAQLREQLHYIAILLDKGLFDQAQPIIMAARKKAEKYGYHDIKMQLIQREMDLGRELSFAGRTGKEMDELCADFHGELEHARSAFEYGAFNARVAMKISRDGFVRNKKALEEYRLFQSDKKLKKVPAEFAAAWHFYIAQISLNFVTRNFSSALTDTNSLISLVESNPHMIRENPRYYLVALHNKMIMLSNLSRYKEIFSIAKKIEEVPVESQLLANRKFYSSHILLLQTYAITGEFEKGLELLKKMKMKLEANEAQLLNAQHEIVYNFTAASIYFGSEQFAAANKHVQHIISKNSPALRRDIHYFALILQMIIQFEMQKQELLEYTVRSVYRFLYKYQRLYKFEDIILQFIGKKLRRVNSKEDLIKAFRGLHKELLPLSNDPLERGAFAHFDIISWLESKIERTSFASVVREKAGT